MRVRPLGKSNYSKSRTGSQYVNLSAGGYNSGAFFTQGVSAKGYVKGVSGLSGYSGQYYGGAGGSYHYNHNNYYSSHYGCGYGNRWWGGYNNHGCNGFYFGFSNHRYNFGFGFNYYPGYYDSCYYPYYRSYSYFPYHYYSTVGYYPGYAPVYNSTYATVSYADTTDPYVEYVDTAPGREPSFDPGIPEAFLTPFVDGFPDGLSPAEALARGETWLREGDYPNAAEAFRRAWLAGPEDYYAPFQLALALLGMGRFDLGGAALEAGLNRNESWVHRRFDVTEAFSSPEAFGALQKDLQRHVLTYRDAYSARFLLGYLFMFSGHEFEAHETFSGLERDGWESRHLKPFVSESSTRLMDTAGPKADTRPGK